MAAAVTAAPPIRRVVEVYKSHLDVGFTEMAAKVTHDATYWLLGVAADTALALRQEPGPRHFTWTVPAYVIDKALETITGAALAKLESALAAGEISWHALPFTTHTELMDEGLCADACAISRKLDRRFGLTTRAAKLTDVPGHTMGLVTALARSGVTFLHIGVNPMSAVPEVPPYFRWQDTRGNELVVAYEPDYARESLLPDDDQLLLWRFVGDNMEVPSVHDIRANRRAALARFPGAEVISGRLDDFADGIVARSHSLPVLRQEIGDSWIHGTGTDPWKTVRYRELLRLRTRWLAQGELTGTALEDFSTNLLLIAEHTWGLAFAGHTHHNQVDWDNGRFHRVRHRGIYQALQASWQEQRDYLELAVEALAPAQAREAVAALAQCDAAPIPTSGWTAIDPSQEIRAGTCRLLLDPADGSVRSLLDGHGVQRVSAGGRLAQLRYQTFDDADCRRYVGQYCRGHGDWLLEEFTKRGLESSQAVSAWWTPALQSAWRRERDGAVELLLGLAFPPLAHDLAGAPRSAQLQLTLPADGSRLAALVQWSGKVATRLPEALWWSFQPQVADPALWRLEKMGQLIDPAQVVSRGGRSLHGVDRGAFYADARQRVSLLTPDAHLVAPGRPALYEFTDEQPDLSGGLHLNLLNNLWGTNFPMWCEDDLRFRAELHWQPPTLA